MYTVHVQNTLNFIVTTHLFISSNNPTPQVFPINKLNDYLKIKDCCRIDAVTYRTSLSLSYVLNETCLLQISRVGLTRSLVINVLEHILLMSNKFTSSQLYLF